MEFDDFWKLYPHKMARKRALKAWNMLDEAQRFAAVESLPIHIRYWEAAGTSREFLPYPATWLNQERWTDELVMPKQKEGGEWWRSGSGIEAKGRELGIVARPGESHDDLKARILAKVGG